MPIKNTPLNSIDNTLRNRFWIDFIYGSSVVEGVDLKRVHVRDIVKKGGRSKLLKNHPTKHLLQAYGQLQSLKMIERLAKNRRPVKSQVLLELHYQTFASIDSEAGKFRQNHIRLRSSSLMPSFPFAISADIRDFDKWLIKAQKNLDGSFDGMVHLIAKAYHEITRIHPFSDGNGRSARLFVNLILRKNNFPYILVPKVDNQKEIREILRAADMGDLDPLVGLQKKLLKQSLKKVVSYWKSKKERKPRL